MLHRCSITLGIRTTLGRYVMLATPIPAREATH